MKALKYYGFKTAILSEGSPTLGNLQKKLGIDYVHANELEIIDGKLTGKYLAILLTVQRKPSTKAIAEKKAYQPNYCRG
jgi:phosphoserine phosphatase